MRPLEVNNKEALLQKYISGNISREEMHLLNEYALDDDFLFDALEGLSINESNNEKVISELQKITITKNKPFKINTRYAIGAAASLALIIFATFIINNYFSNLSVQSITMDTESNVKEEMEATNKEFEMQTMASPADEASESSAEEINSSEITGLSDEKSSFDAQNQPNIKKEANAETANVENDANAGLPRQLTLRTPPAATKSSPALKSNTAEKSKAADQTKTIIPAADYPIQLKKITLNEGKSVNNGNQKLNFTVKVLGNTILDDSKLKTFASYLEEKVEIPEETNLALLNGELTLRIILNKDNYSTSVSSPSITENPIYFIQEQIEQLTASYPWKEIFKNEEGNYTLSVLF